LNRTTDCRIGRIAIATIVQFLRTGGLTKIVLGGQQYPTMEPRSLRIRVDTRLALELILVQWMILLYIDLIVNSPFE